MVCSVYDIERGVRIMEGDGRERRLEESKALLRGTAKRIQNPDAFSLWAARFADMCGKFGSPA